MPTALENANAVLSKLTATRQSRARAEFVAASTSAYLREIALRSTSSDDAFATLQGRPEQSVASAIALLPTIKNAVAELEALLPEIQASYAAE